MSALGHKRTFAKLFDHLIGNQQKVARDRQAEDLGRLQVDDQLELRRELYGHFRGLGAFQDFVQINRGRAVEIVKVRPIEASPPSSTPSLVA